MALTQDREDVVKQLSSQPHDVRDLGPTHSHPSVWVAALTLAALTLLGLLMGTARGSAEEGKIIVAENTKIGPDQIQHKHLAGVKYEDITINKKGNTKTKPINTGNLTTARDASSGLPTGKRMHKPFSVTKEIDKASPTMMSVPSKRPATVYQGGLLEGGTTGAGATTGPAATGSPVNRGGASAGRLN